MSDSRLIVGCMTGTSIDGIDLALVEVTGKGTAIDWQVVATDSRPLGEIADRLRYVAFGGEVTAREFSEIALRFGELHADVVGDLIGERTPTLIAVHGQTVFHEPPLSWQLINASPIAHRFKCPVLYDLRAADLAAGGQGAPITPIADHVLFGDAHERRAVVNLGGFCNFTILTPSDTDPLAAIEAGDLCACNQVLDHVARTRLQVPFDRNGDVAAGGAIIESMFDRLHESLSGQHVECRSLGSGDELNQVLDSLRLIDGADLARTACAAIAQTIADRISGCTQIVIAGGGVHNRTLVEELSLRCDSPVRPSDSHGVPVQYREAISMAILGALAEDRVPITLPQVTHPTTQPRHAGVWIYP